MTEAATCAKTRMDPREPARALPPRQRAVTVLRHSIDLPETETADIPGCSVGNVTSQSSKAIKQLWVGAFAAPTHSGEGEAA